MKAITLHELWASFVAMGLKTIETRVHDRFKCLVGHRIAIHAGKKFDPRATYRASTILAEHGFAGAKAPSVDIIIPRHGQVVCTAMVNSARRLNKSDNLRALIECGGLVERFGIFLGDIYPIADTTIVKGKQGIWTWTPPDGVQTEAA